MNKEKVCCFTGHRPQKLSFGFNEQDERCLRLKQILRETVETMITQYGVTHFISGMAIGIDLYAAEIVLSLKNKYPDITLECALPCETQCEKWSEALRNRYFDVLEFCDRETLLQTHYTADCMQKRNRYMIDSSDYVIAVWNGSPGGTAKTVEYARSCGKPVWFISDRERVKEINTSA